METVIYINKEDREEFLRAIHEHKELNIRFKKWVDAYYDSSSGGPELVGAQVVYRTIAEVFFLGRQFQINVTTKYFGVS